MNECNASECSSSFDSPLLASASKDVVCDAFFLPLSQETARASANEKLYGKKSCSVAPGLRLQTCVSRHPNQNAVLSSSGEDGCHSTAQMRRLKCTNHHSRDQEFVRQSAFHNNASEEDPNSECEVRNLISVPFGSTVFKASQGIRALKPSNSKTTATVIAPHLPNLAATICVASKRQDNHGVYYLEPESLEPITPSPNNAFLQQTLTKLSSADWKLQFEALTTVRRLAKHHEPELIMADSAGVTKVITSKRFPASASHSFLHLACISLVELIDSLRSNVAKNAMLTVVDLYSYASKLMSEMHLCDAMLSICLKKAGASGAGNFLIVEAEKALIQICTAGSPPGKLISLLLRNLKEARSNQRLKSVIAQCIILVITQLPTTLAALLSSRELNVLVDSCIKLTSESASVCRKYGKLAIVLIRESLAEADISKLRQALSESKLKELSVASRLAGRLLDVSTILGMDIGQFISVLPMARVENAESIAVPGERLTTPLRTSDDASGLKQQNSVLAGSPSSPQLNTMSEDANLSSRRPSTPRPFTNRVNRSHIPSTPIRSAPIRGCGLSVPTRPDNTPRRALSPPSLDTPRAASRHSVSVRVAGDRRAFTPHLERGGDKISLSAGADKISLRAGADKISLRAGADKISMRAGARFLVDGIPPPLTVSRESRRVPTLLDNNFGDEVFSTAPRRREDSVPAATRQSRSLLSHQILPHNLGATAHLPSDHSQYLTEITPSVTRRPALFARIDEKQMLAECDASSPVNHRSLTPRHQSQRVRYDSVPTSVAGRKISDHNMLYERGGSLRPTHVGPKRMDCEQ